MKSKCKIFLFIISVPLLILSCKKVSQKDIIGIYEIDKFINKGISSEEHVFEFIILKDDYTFELRDSINNSFNSAKGRWEIINSSYQTNFAGKEEPRVSLKIFYHNRIVTPSLEGTILYFDYPDDLYNGRFEKVLYVKNK